ncbi:MAG: hypothetical protein A2268_02430 [Candidatus Raymondbacteria bacterium RifOxyA12_full_50_37]|uniref:Uncharacterized protein n=1 Tax=Candidatus Raymondbacteria bacterium RIFOXYD12_FULL_49_13 TaxID=1817890 RepID=A0A1F7F340_UNCRA|nr:MAG: hypothetical protein A2268_02430 [Candidatus Raymondbacteria bacterium RifOxyA12_full_50_37]OGJ89142.1 MAG: hypothetical protein A2248_11335 [Candidatus Raymondbacteria bacterium RIFOXYA2_FULL_49_16]OGJ96624.1 MAG: hypothetical protein A2453_06450 [Candidatus Raymondbacteria bacterium RIFOXYC2_FULL_50_21]OGK01075.1 MAG: hypothetical protein A2519_16930 [Candidatus Raymondbacteria bacterium RIFOXYD12_FULL_49_13]OGP42184.1 MAG: hypothetical protein A2324_02175 [Candidatus Raymondbacteria 
MSNQAGIVDRILSRVHKNHWNTISYFSSFFTLPRIASPINFDDNCGFTLSEHLIMEMDEELRREFLNFCYPADLPHRSQEIAYDRQYWSTAATFIVRDTGSTIVGCAQYIVKSRKLKLPVEYAVLADGERAGDHFSTGLDVGGDCIVSEIYRLRRSFELGHRAVCVVVNMLFKAIWAKIVQTNTVYSYITCDGDSPELKNMYTKRLFFQDSGHFVRYGQDLKRWRLMRKDCMLHEQKFATLSRTHFQMQTYFRANLKTKRLRLPVKSNHQPEHAYAG